MRFRLVLRAVVPDVQIACNRLRRLGEVSRVANKSLIIAKVRGDEDSPLAAKYKVDGFPTFLFFAPDSTKSESYDGPRDVNSIIKYINSKLDVHLAPPKSRENNIAAPVDGFIELDGRSIVENIARPWGFFLIFYLPWCVHCNKLAAELPKIAKIVEQSGHQDKIVLGKVNIGLHAALAATYFITNYPAIQFYEPRSDGPVMYSGPREALPIVKWMEHVSKLNLRNKVEESWVVQLAYRRFLTGAFVVSMLLWVWVDVSLPAALNSNQNKDKLVL